MFSMDMKKQRKFYAELCFHPFIFTNIFVNIQNKWDSG